MNQKRYINLLSNLYNNLSNVYLALKKTDKATEALHKAFEIRISYADTGIIETHDMLQQMLNLVNMLILAGDLELARLVLNQYDALVTDNEGYNTLDYGCCRLASGIIALKEGKPVEAEKNLLAAESIINTATVSPFPAVLHHVANTPSHSALSYLFPAKYTLLLPFKNEKQPENVLLMVKL